jgi:hypothetical protein
MRLESFQKVVSFLRSQGIEPGLDMLRLEAKEWNKLLKLANEYEKTVEQHTQPELSEAELEEEKRIEAEANLFHSSG